MKFLLDLLFPPHCFLCGTDLADQILCAGCLAAIPLHQGFFCGECGARLPVPVDGGGARRPGVKKVCHLSYPYRLGAAASYAEPAVQQLILQLKFHNVRRAAEPLGELMTQYLRAVGFSFPPNAVLLPVPLSSRRLRERGYNQAELLAKILSRNFGLALAPDLLLRSRHTQPQSKLSATDRAANVAGCFAVARPLPPRRRFFLVDDVTTSGTTLFAAAKTMQAAGARGLVALVAAKV